MKRWKIGSTIVIILLLASASLLADESVFVTGIRIATRDPEVRITWRDAPSYDGTYRIYRHTAAIDRESFSDAVFAGTVEPGIEAFVDRPPTPGFYYYAVVAHDADDTPVTEFITFQNVSSQPVEITSTASLEQIAAEVTSITATPGTTAITINLVATRADREVVVYRSIQPFHGLEGLQEATRIATVTGARVEIRDDAIPGVPYYYAAFDAALVAAGSIAPVAGRNVLTESVEIPLPAAAARVAPQPTGPRDRPLPLLRITPSLSADARSLSTLPERRELDRVTLAAVRSLLASAPDPRQPDRSPEILEIDRISTNQGIDGAIHSIVTGPLANGRWDETAELLRNVREAAFDFETQARIAFYRGQALFFAGNTREAFFEFLTAEEALRERATPWIKATLSESAID